MKARKVAYEPGVLKSIAQIAARFDGFSVRMDKLVKDLSQYSAKYPARDRVNCSYIALSGCNEIVVVEYRFTLDHMKIYRVGLRPIGKKEMVLPS